MFAANLHFNALRQGKDVPIARGTRGTHVRTRGTAAIGALACAGSPRGSVHWQQPRARVLCCA